MSFLQASARRPPPPSGGVHHPKASAAATAFLLTLKRLEQIPLLAFLIFGFIPRAAAAQEAIYLVRHAEQVQEGDDPPPTGQGQQRARALAQVVAEAGTSPLDIQKSVLLEAESTPNISTEELRRILAERSAPVFDVRTYKEYAISHIPGAISVAPKPGTSREEYVSDIVEIGRVVKGDKAAPMILYCSGPQCGKSKRVAAELVAAGYTNVRRYQLGIPVWRALGEVTKTEVEGVRYVAKNDQTAVFIDAREPDEFNSGTLPGARNIPRSRVDSGTFDVRYRAWRHPGGAEVKAAKADGRLPMEDHNARIIVFGSAEGQARWVAEALVRNSFHNVSFCDLPYAKLKETLK